MEKFIDNLLNYVSDDTRAVLHARGMLNKNKHYSDDNDYGIYTDLKSWATNIDYEYGTTYASDIKNAYQQLEDDK